MRRVVNFRPCAVIFAFCAAGVLSSLAAYFYFALGVALIAVTVSLALALLIVSAVKGKAVAAITFAVAVAVTVAACAMFFSSLSGRITLREDVTYTISGRLTESFTHDGGELTAVLGDLVVNGLETDGNMTAVFTDDYGDMSGLDTGDRVTFSSNVSPAPLIADDGSVNASYVRTDMRYYVYAEAADVYSVTEGEPTFLESARLLVRDTLVSCTDETTGGIAYGMIVGDRFAIPDAANEAYSAAGIGHVLSVSGLHISLAAMMLSRLIEALRAPYLASCITVTALLALYTVFTGAAASAVRALVMYAMSLWSRYLGRRDALNSLFAACTVCLMISPFYLFECGFLLSAGSVYGLIAFSRPVSSLFRRLRFPRFLADGLGASLAVQVAILPLTAVFFSEIGLYAIVVNALLMPLLSAVFVLLVALLPLMLIPPLFFVGYLPAVGIGWMSALSAFVASLPLAVIVVKVSALAALVLPVSFIASRYVLVGNRYMRAIAAVTLSCFLVIASRNGIMSDNAVVFLGGASAATVVVQGSNAAIVADWEHASSVSSAVSRSRIANTSFEVHVLDLGYDAAMGIAEFARDYTVTRVVVLPSGDLEGVGVLVDRGIPVEDVSDGGMLDVAYVGGTARGWVHKAGGKLCFFTTGTVGDDLLPYFDILRGKSYYGDAQNVYAAYTEKGNVIPFGESEKFSN